MSTLNLFRKVALVEAISYLLLLFVAMPFKYLMDMPLGVKYIGMAHGLLFVAYVVLLVMVWQERKWSFLKVVGLFVGSLLPFVPFYLEKKLKEEATLA